MGHLRPGSIALGLGASHKEEALSKIVDVAVSLEPSLDKVVLLQALAEREAVVTTGIGRGMAIPHADLPTVPIPMLCLGVFPKGVDFESMDEEPVSVMFLLLGTGRHPEVHLQLLSDIARLSKEPQLLPRFLTARGEDDVVDFLQEVAKKTGL
jgi:mannitol/fructose-specific phosphotransferase system IIA component (Ntr-type)